MMLRKRTNQPPQAGAIEKVLDVTAGLQGEVTFKDPVNLCIQGSFEGKLQTKGRLTIGKTAHVKADIEGDTITIAGKVSGKVVARELLRMASTGECVGEIQTPRLSVEEGGVLHGQCQMRQDTETPSALEMTLAEAARYLEVDLATITEWTMAGKIPSIGEEGGWKFDKAALEAWVSQQKLKT